MIKTTNFDYSDCEFIICSNFVILLILDDFIFTLNKPIPFRFKGYFTISFLIVNLLRNINFLKR